MKRTTLVDGAAQSTVAMPDTSSARWLERSLSTPSGWGESVQVEHCGLEA